MRDFGVSEQTVHNWLNERKVCQNPNKTRIAELEAELKETKICQVLNVSRSRFYDWDGRDPSKRKATNEKILEVMKYSHTKAQWMIGLDKQGRRFPVWA